jgi:DNA-binding HxlR family transcriptional regulator
MATACGGGEQQCDAALVRAFSVLGKRWSGLLLATLADGPATYSRLARAVTGIGPSTLSERLGALGSEGLITRLVVDGPPVSVSYELTPMGHALVPVLDQLGAWAAEWMTEDERTD